MYPNSFSGHWAFLGDIFNWSCCWAKLICWGLLEFWDGEIFCEAAIPEPQFPLFLVAFCGRCSHKLGCPGAAPPSTIKNKSPILLSPKIPVKAQLCPRGGGDKLFLLCRNLPVPALVLYWFPVSISSRCSIPQFPKFPFFPLVPRAELTARRLILSERFFLVIFCLFLNLLVRFAVLTGKDF